MTPPEFNIDPQTFWQDPYPALAEMRKEAPVCFVPQLGATLITKRDEISTCEKNIAMFSSDQPDGLMNVLMGCNMMRKDGDAHMNERKQAFPSLSPRTVRDVWTAQFVQDCDAVLDEMEEQRSCDLIRDFALPVSGHALRHITGLTNLTPEQMDSVSQGMIDGIANYAGDPAIEARCHASTKLIDDSIDVMLKSVAEENFSLLSVLVRSGQPMEQVRANIKLAISGGQNEPRDAIAGTTWALLTHPDQLDMVRWGTVTWQEVFEEYARWISPIGMSPRRIAQPFTWKDVELESESRVFFMFSSGNRDEDVFDAPDVFDVTRNTAKSISFGAGPHFCAGAWASRALIADVALPRLFARFPKLALDGDVPFGGWAFRGPLKMPVALR